MRLGVRGKIFLMLLGAVFLVVSVSGVFLTRELRSNLYSRTESEIGRQAEALAVLMDDHLESPEISSVDRMADRLGSALGMRVTVIDQAGAVRGDSELDPVDVERLENHLERPEVAAAFEGKRGISWRYSTTVEHQMIYCASRFDNDGASWVVRVSRSVEDVDEAVAALYGILLVAGLLGLALAAIMGVITSHYFSRTLRQLIDYARNAVDGKRNGTLIESGDELGGLASSVRQLSEELERRLDELAMERNRFSAVLDGMSEAVIALDEYRRVTLINSEGIHLLGLGEQPIGKTILETMRVPELNALLNEVEPGKTARVEFDFGKTLPRRVLATASRRPAGDYVVVFLDVTELRKLESIRKDFVSNVSHELRTPVSIIKANAETLIDGAIDDSEASRRFLDSLVVNSERLSNLISDLLDISRIEEGKYDLQVEEVPLTLSLRRAAASLETRAIEKSTSIRVEVGGDIAVRADVKALDQVLFNLVDNAVKYTPVGGKVVLRAVEEGERIRVEVEDDGPGVEERYRGRLFERFFRVDKGRSREMGGTGLGLSIVKHLVMAMEGEVGMRQADGGGSVFWLELKKQ